MDNLANSHKMALRNQDLQVAQLIDTFVKNILAKGGGDEEILAGMLPYMQGFKGIMNNAAAGEMDSLASQYDGFHKFAKLLEKLAGGIQDGVIEVPK